MHVLMYAYNMFEYFLDHVTVIVVITKLMEVFIFPRESVPLRFCRKGYYTVSHCSAFN